MNQLADLVFFGRVIPERCDVSITKPLLLQFHPPDGQSCVRWPHLSRQPTGFLKLDLEYNSPYVLGPVETVDKCAKPSFHKVLAYEYPVDSYPPAQEASRYIAAGVL